MPEAALGAMKKRTVIGLLLFALVVATLVVLLTVPPPWPLDLTIIMQIVAGCIGAIVVAVFYDLLMNRILDDQRDAEQKRIRSARTYTSGPYTFSWSIQGTDRQGKACMHARIEDVANGARGIAPITEWNQKS